MKSKILSIFAGLALASSISISALAVTAQTTLITSGTTAYASLSVANNFSWADASTDLSQEGEQISRELAVAAFAYSSSGTLLDYDGLYYGYVHVGANVNGGSSTSSCRSYHAILDATDTVLDSERLVLNK